MSTLLEGGGVRRQSSESVRSALLILCLLCVPASRPAAAQAPQQRISPSECYGCRVTLTFEARLGTIEGPAALAGHALAVVRDSRGRFYLADSRDPTRVIVFNGDGSFRTTIGRSGEGPGEFKSVSQLFIVEDTLHVFDFGLIRESVFTPDGEFVRSYSVPLWVNGVTDGPGDSVLVSAFSSHPNTIGLPLHLLSPDRRVEESFGSDGTYFANRPLERFRAITRAQSSYWSAPRYEYVLSEWDFDGTHVRDLVRQAEWFEPWVPERPTFTAERPGRPSLVAIASLDDRLLAAVTMVPAEDWPRAIGEPVRTEGGALRYPDAGRARAWDSIVEVIDVASGTLLWSQRIDPRVFAFVGNDRLAAFSEVGDGYPAVDVWRIAFEVRGRGNQAHFQPRRFP